MPPLQDEDEVMEDEYDEEADSDFASDGSAGGDSSSSEVEDQDTVEDSSRPRKRRKLEKPQPLITELDSGDEATIKEQRKTHRKVKTQSAVDQYAAPEGDGEDSEGWRARTRAMRNREKEERKQNKLASTKTSTVDVDKLWEEMNRPGPLPLPTLEENTGRQDGVVKKPDNTPTLDLVSGGADKDHVPVMDGAETITIKRTYKFAGEVYVEEKTVPKSSAEAQLWLSQQQSVKTARAAQADGTVANRPLRKISRFDPNLNNIASFRNSWLGRNADTHDADFKGPKLNVVEKSKMDWATHVDAEGLQEELDTHAKAKEGYLTRMDFLREVEARKETEARAARLKGH